MTNPPFTVALPGDSMWQRAIAKRVVRKVEVSFALLDGTSISGWVTGLDENWLQLTDRRLEMHIISLDKVVALTETGFKFHEVDFTPEDRQKFEAFTNRFNKVCQETLRRAGDSAYHHREDRS